MTATEATTRAMAEWLRANRGATAAPNRPAQPLPRTAEALWALVPESVRRALLARPPLACEDHGTRSPSVIASVGAGNPWRWLQLQAGAGGALDVRLWEVRRAAKCLAAESCPPAELPALLTRWAKAYGLSG